MIRIILLVLMSFFFFILLYNVAPASAHDICEAQSFGYVMGYALASMTAGAIISYFYEKQRRKRNE